MKTTAVRPPKARRLPRRYRRWLALGYAAGVLGYLLLSLLTQTGLVGQLVAWQVRWLAYGSEKHAFLLALVVLAGPVLWWLRGQGPGRSPQLPPPKPSLARRLTHPLPRPSARRYWYRLLGLAGGIVVVAGLAQGVQYALDQGRRQPPAYALALEEATTAPVDGRPVLVTGTLHPRYQYITQRRRYASVLDETTYVPLTPRQWQPPQPVRYLLTLRAADYQAPAARRLVAQLEEAHARPFSVAAPALVCRQALPAVVRMALTDQGLHLAADCCQLEYRPVLPAGPGEARPPVLLLAGGSIALLLLLGGGALFLWLRRHRVFAPTPRHA